MNFVSKARKLNQGKYLHRHVILFVLDLPRFLDFYCQSKIFKIGSS